MIKTVAKIKSTLDIQLDLTRPVEELTEVISAVISSQPHKRKEILIGLDYSGRKYFSRDSGSRGKRS
jgi:hypothetical protein